MKEKTHKRCTGMKEKTQKEQIAILKKALLFYSDDSHYMPGRDQDRLRGGLMKREIMNDGGAIARKALQLIKHKDH